MIITVPALIPVTTPVLEIVAMAVLDDAHGAVACAVADPVNVEENPTQALKVPEIVGSAFTVNVAVCVQLFEFL